ncbi:hypothetical protein FS837_001845, partial [Tulasnella sp. UAMH 9824]
MLPSSSQRPYQVPGYSNPGGDAYTSFRADPSARYLFPQPGGFGSTLNTSAGYLLQENGYRLQTLTERTVSAQGGVEPALRTGNTLDGGRRLEDTCFPTSPLDPQQHSNKPHKQEGLVNTSNDMRIKGFPSKLYKLMQDPAAQACIYWDNHGTVIIIPSQGELENANLLNRYFGHNKFDSLVRQFNNYAFRKLSRAGSAGDHPQVHLYSHEKFIRGREDLLCEVKPKPKARELPNEPIRCPESRHSTLSAVQIVSSPTTAPQLETRFGRTISTPQEDTQQLSRRFSRMNESVVALEKRNSLLENENMMLKSANAALQEENKALKETNTRLQRYIGTLTTQFNSLKTCLIQWTGSMTPYMTGSSVCGFYLSITIGSPYPDYQVLDTRPKAGVPTHIWYTESLHQPAGGVVPSAAYESQTSISLIQTPDESSRATSQTLQGQSTSYPPVPGLISLDTPYRRSPETQETRASGSSAPHAYWGNQPYIEGVNRGLAMEHQYAADSQTRQPLADSTL